MPRRECPMIARRILALAAAAVALVAGPATGAEGVPRTSITSGQSAAPSGPAAELGNDMRKGILAHFDHVNRGGGVNGRKLVLKSLDDGYEATRAAENTRTLV